MKFSYFRSVKVSKGEILTRERYLEVSNSTALLQLCKEIAAEEDADKRGQLKKQLPIVTWQASFPGRRVNSEAVPSGLFMLDIDHVDDPFALYSEKVAGHTKELGIVYVGKTASTHGLRIVAKCLPTLHTLEENQRWLAGNLKVEYDACCKDLARASYLVHDSYTYYMDAKGIWQDEPAEGFELKTEASPKCYSAGKSSSSIGTKEAASANDGGTGDQREGLFGGPSDFKGIPYDRIIREWFYHTGGEPTEGERNTRLYQLAIRLRYITDFNEATLLRVMPRYGLPEEEVREIVRHALKVSHGQNYPLDLQETLDKIDRQIKLKGDETEETEDAEIITDTTKVPILPPLFKEWYETAPADFKVPVILCQLPILGALGSRLRAKYLDGKIHSPSFQVSLEAPQASGKSFLGRLVDMELAQMKEADEAQRELERQYTEKVAEMKLLNIKINADNKDEILGQKPKGIIRYVPATMSITKLLMRMDAAQGLHLFAFAPEIDTVLKAFKRGFSSFSDALRVSFDNDEYGQDYASDQSWSGNIRLYYNCLFSGTPKAMCRFYPDVEDGLVSRVLFVTLPDQFGKPMPIWAEMNKEQQLACDIALTKLNEISLQGKEVQPEHMMKMDWLNKHLEKWVKEQQAEAVRLDDRTRDIFCRRAAVVGFRAGMLAWFLWDEKNVPPVRRKVCNFATFIANNMLNQHILRFNVNTVHSNVNQWEEIFESLGDEFTRADVEKALMKAESTTPVRVVLYKWRLLGVIKDMEKGRTGKTNQATIVKFKKVKQ